MPYNVVQSLCGPHGGRKLSPEAFGGASRSSLFQAEGDGGSFKTLTEAEASFLGFTKPGLGPKAEPGSNTSNLDT